MGEGFDVDPEAIRDLGLGLRDEIGPLVREAGQVPEADAGLMTVVIERALAALLDGLVGYAARVADMGDDMVRSALHYHWADQEARAGFAGLLLPGTTPGQADALVADAPGSVWAQVAEDQTGDLRDLLSGGAGTGSPSTTTGEHGDGLDALLLGPLGGSGREATDAD